MKLSVRRGCAHDLNGSSPLFPTLRNQFQWSSDPDYSDDTTVQLPLALSITIPLLTSTSLIVVCLFLPTVVSSFFCPRHPLAPRTTEPLGPPVSPKTSRLDRIAMYQPSYPSSQGYVSPPPPGAGGQGFRSPPMAGQPYPGFTSPVSPPPPNAYSPMSSGQSQSQSRFQQQPYALSPPNTGHYPRQSRHVGQNGYGQVQAPPQAGRPPAAGGGPPKYKGTIAPGTMVQVGEHQVRVERYLSEGGYAHVYLTRSDKPIHPPVKGAADKKGRWGERGFTEHCLKRIAFEDDSVWTDVKKEIEVMVSIVL
jgi:hypothetical protein